jgi:hypothetical protein
LLAPADRHAQSAFFLFLIAMTVAPGGLTLMAPLLLGGNQRGRLSAER